MTIGVATGRLGWVMLIMDIMATTDIMDGIITITYHITGEDLI